MIEINKGNLLDGVVATDAHGYSTFKEMNNKRGIILIEGDYPVGIKFAVVFKGQVDAATACYEDYKNDVPLVLDKNGKVELQRLPDNIEIGVQAQDSNGVYQPSKVYPNFYIGIF